MAGYQAPLVRQAFTWIPARTAATDGEQAVAVAPFDGVVSKCSLTPEAAVTGATATKRTFTLTNRKQDGSGTVAVGVLDLITGTNLVKDDEMLFTLNAAPANAVAQGDVLSVVETHASTGTAHSGGEILIEFTRA